MSRKVVFAEKAPKAAGPYSHAIIANGFVYCSGQTGIVPATGVLAPGEVAEQTHQVFTNIRTVLEAAGSTLAKVVKSNVYLHDMGDFQRMNAVYAEYFPENPPARTTVGNLNLPGGALIEI